MKADIWTVAEAKAKFSEVVERARCGTPQTITRNRRTAVVVVSAEEWERKFGAKVTSPNSSWCRRFEPPT